MFFSVAVGSFRVVGRHGFSHVLYVQMQLYFYVVYHLKLEDSLLVIHLILKCLALFELSVCIILPLKHEMKLRRCYDALKSFRRLS